MKESKPTTFKGVLLCAFEGVKRLSGSFPKQVIIFSAFFLVSNCQKNTPSESSFNISSLNPFSSEYSAIKPEISQMNEKFGSENYNLTSEDLKALSAEGLLVEEEQKKLSSLVK